MNLSKDQISTLRAALNEYRQNPPSYLDDQYLAVIDDELWREYHYGEGKTK